MTTIERPLPLTTTVKPSVPEALEKLEALGSVRHIAEHLRDQRVCGDLCEASSCALAVWLRKQTGHGDVHVSTDVAYWDIVDFDLKHWKWHALPWHVREFVNEFDNGLHPELIKGWEQPRIAV